jgi:hypothetical protein
MKWKCICAVLEKTVNSKDLLAEILPLLEEYFIAGFDLTDENIVVEMLNKQKFRIIIEEIKEEE